MKAAIFPNFNKKNALSCAQEVCAMLRSCGAEALMDISCTELFGEDENIHFGIFAEFLSQADIAVAIGGDGTILRCANKIVESGIPLLGINTGRLGFMSSIESTELDFLPEIIKGNYRVDSRMLLKIGLVRADGNSEAFTALNEVFIGSSFSKLVDFELFSDGKAIVSCRADGVVLSTPTGSTAYAFSAGGPIIEPSLQCIEFAQVCPHSLFSRAMLFSPDKRLELRFNPHRAPEMYFSIDGAPPRRLLPDEYIEVTRSEHTIGLIDVKGASFYDSVDRKLMKPLK